MKLSARYLLIFAAVGISMQHAMAQYSSASCNTFAPLTKAAFSDVTAKSSQAGFILVSDQFSNAGNLTDNSLTNSSSFSFLALGTGWIEVKDNKAVGGEVYPAGTFAGFVVSDNALLTALGSVTITTFLGTTQQEQASVSSLVSTSLLSSQQSRVGFTTTKSFDRIRFTYSALLLGSINVFYAVVGRVCRSSISGQVFDDNDGNVPNGRVFSGAGIVLKNEDGTTAGVTTTDSSGRYSFGNILPGAYKVVLTLPSGFFNVGSSEGDKDGSTQVTLTESAAAGINFGINQPPAAKNDQKKDQPVGPVSIPILSNDMDPNGGILSTHNVELIPPAGELVIKITTDSIAISQVTVAGEGTWSLGNGSLTFMPIISFKGNPTPIQYVITDMAGLLSDTVAVGITFVSAPLPVRLAGFSCKWAGHNQIQLDWKTEREENFSHFEVLMGEDPVRFESMGTVPSKNKTKDNRYRFYIRRDNIQIGYFRLKMIDRDGMFEYSDVLSLEGSDQVLVSPNPFSDHIFVRKMTVGSVITISDMFGREKMRMDTALDSQTDVVLNVRNFVPGAYVVSITSPTGLIRKWRVLK